VRASSPRPGSPAGKKGEDAKSLGLTKRMRQNQVTGAQRMARGLRTDEPGSLLERLPAMQKKLGDAERIRRKLLN